MNNFHLAGIIPVAGQPLEFNMPWHDSLMPIAPDYLALERSVVECAYAGCETIWIVCNDDIQPLIRYRLGEYIQDPVWVLRNFAVEKRGHQKPISIYYVPIHPKDRGKRDCLSWSVLYGALTATKISSGLSTWLKPNRYYVSFPYGVYDPKILREHRKIISSDQDFYLINKNKTVIDGEYLGFTFDYKTYELLFSEVKEKSTGLYEGDRKLSIEERFSYRFFTLKDVFGSLKLGKATLIEVEQFHNISNWHGYCDYISTDGRKAQKPSKFILNYKEWNGIGIDN